MGVFTASYSHTPIPPHSHTKPFLLLALVLLLLAPLPVLAGKDDESAAKQGIVSPAEWSFPAVPPLRVWTVRGLWYEQYGLDRALARVGGAQETSSWVGGDRPRWYAPDSYDELMRYQLVIIANTNGDAFKGGNGGVLRKRLKDYVEHGGSVLFLGGLFAFGGEYHGTALEDLSPVSYADARDLVAAPEGLSLAPGADTLGKGWASLHWNAGPRVYWYHAVTPKPGAKVLLTAGGKPLLIAGSYGKGHVAVFAGSVMGDPKDGQVPFWAWDGWPAVMAETLTWLVEVPERPTAVTQANFTKALTAQLAKAGGKKPVEQEIVLRFTRQCADKVAAGALLDALLALSGDISQDLSDTIYAQILPYTDTAFAAAAKALTQSGRTHKTMLGLRLLGLTKAAGAQNALLDALKRGVVEVEGAEEDEQDREAAGTDPEYRAYVYRLAALEGLGNLGDVTALPALREAITQYAKGRLRREDFSGTITPIAELYQAALVAALRCGDAGAAAPTVDMLLQNRFTLVNMMFGATSDGKGPAAAAQRAKAQHAFARLQARQALAYLRLSGLPAAVMPALAKRLAAEDDPWVTPIAFAAFGKGFNAGPLPKDALELLKSSKVPAVADLAGGY